MKRITVSAMTLVLLLTSMLTVAFHVQPVRAEGSIYIRADGSIDPVSAPIHSDDNFTYTLSDNIQYSGNESALTIERNDILIDGNSHQVFGQVGSCGFNLTNVRNVTIENIDRIWAFRYVGIYVSNSSDCTIKETTLRINGIGVWLLNSSHHNEISRNLIMENVVGIQLEECLNNDISENNITGNTNGMGALEIIKSSMNNVTGNSIVGNGGIGVECTSFSNNNTLFGNNVTANGNFGILLADSLDNIILGNDVAANNDGLWLTRSPENQIIENNITQNNRYGLLLNNCSKNVLRNNTMVGNRYNFEDSGDAFAPFNDVDTSNTVDGKSIFYVLNSQYLTIDSKTKPEPGYLVIANSTNITVRDLTFRNNGVGVIFAFTNDSSIRNSVFTDNRGGVFVHSSTNVSVSGNNTTSSELFGVWLLNSSDNEIMQNHIGQGNVGILIGYEGLGGGCSGNRVFRNTMTNNEQGLILSNSSVNKIFHNDFEENRVQGAVFGPCYNSLDDGYPSGGNYWSDYNGMDLFSGPFQNETGSDGIGDTHYTIDPNNTDNYPLMIPWGSILGDVNDNGKVEEDDLLLIASHFGKDLGDPDYYRICDLNGDGYIGIDDIFTAAINLGKEE